MSAVPRVRTELRALADPEKAAFFPRFFKAGPGQYAEGDQFLGVTVPNVRRIAKQYASLPLDEIAELLHSHWHEERLLALVLLVGRYQRGTQLQKDRVYEFYMENTVFINNWDLVDASAQYIVAPQLEQSPYKLKVLQKLAGSELVWDRRIAMLSTFHYIKQGRADEALIIAEQLLHDKHDLIQKAAGWMLREVGKRVDYSLLAAFLDEHAASMPRTTLRYAIEHFTAERRAYYLALKGVK